MDWPFFGQPDRKVGTGNWPFADASVSAKLPSLTRLALSSKWDVPETLADVVGALVSLTGLAELSIDLPQPAVVPATLAQLKGLRSLELRNMSPCCLRAGCLELPNLVSLKFTWCNFDEAEALPGVTALQCLTRIEFSGKEGPCYFDPRLVQLPLQRMVMWKDTPCTAVSGSAPLRLLMLPADMGLLCSTLLHRDMSGLRLAQFPIALTQLVALKCLDASRYEFAELPAGITALSRLTEVTFGRVDVPINPGWQLPRGRPLSAIAMGDLSSFPALRKLTFVFCEVKLCMSVLGGAVRHTSLESLCFLSAFPEHECELMVLQLSRTLWGLRRGSMVKCGFDTWRGDVGTALYKARGRVLPSQKFKAALEACGP